MTFRAGIWKDLIPQITGVAAGGAAPAMGGILASGNIQGYTFQTSDALYGTFELPADYQEGTDLTVHLHWMPSSANTGNLVWAFEYSVANIGSVSGAPTVLPNTSVPAGVAWTHQISTFATTIPGAGLKIQSIIVFRLLRNNTGNGFTGNAILTSLGAFYQADSMGSNSQTTKN